MPSTVTSLSELHTHLDPSSPPEYLQHVIVSTLHRKGFHAAEAGALAEMERLLERRRRTPAGSSADGRRSRIVLKESGLGTVEWQGTAKRDGRGNGPTIQDEGEAAQRWVGDSFKLD